MEMKRPGEKIVSRFSFSFQQVYFPLPSFARAAGHYVRNKNFETEKVKRKIAACDKFLANEFKFRMILAGIAVIIVTAVYILL